MPLDVDVLYACPSCAEENAIGIDPTGGRRQRLVEDCPVCCRPLVFDVIIDGDGDALLQNVECE